MIYTSEFAGRKIVTGHNLLILMYWFMPMTLLRVKNKHMRLPS
jgi:hypothetical protein